MNFDSDVLPGYLVGAALKIAGISATVYSIVKSFNNSEMGDPSVAIGAVSYMTGELISKWTFEKSEEKRFLELEKRLKKDSSSDSLDNNVQDS